MLESYCICNERTNKILEEDVVISESPDSIPSLELENNLEESEKTRVAE